MNHYTQNYECTDDSCPPDKQFLTILYSQYAVVKGKKQYVAMNCFGASRTFALDKANSITDGRIEAEIKRLKRIEKAKDAKQRKG